VERLYAHIGAESRSRRSPCRLGLTGAPRSHSWEIFAKSNEPEGPNLEWTNDIGRGPYTYCSAFSIWRTAA